jgi:ParB family chromosome partitioning protein
MSIAQQTLDFDELLDPHALDGSHISDGWYTPAWITDAARQVMGAIDLDPATCAAAQNTVLADKWYTKTEDGLSQPWAGRVWLNPPYSDPTPWTEKLLRTYRSGDVSMCMALTNCSCSPKWAQPLWHHCSAVCLLNKRVNFWHPSKTNAHGAYDRDSALFYFGPLIDQFDAVFSRHGAILKGANQ